MDALTEDDRQVLEELVQTNLQQKPFFISAVAQKGLSPLLRTIWSALDSLNESEREI